jgi:hypothetical protein
MKPTNNRRMTAAALAILAPVFLLACGQADDGEMAECDPSATTTVDGVTVTNDQCALESQVDRTMADIAIMPSADAVTSPLKYVAASNTKTTLTLMATVAPPVVNGKTLQASGVAFRGNYAVVSYMTIGEPVGGAVDIINVTNREKPTLTSRITFDDADVIAADFSSSVLYYAGSTSSKTVKTRALLGGIKLTSMKFDTSETGRVSLPSYAGTAVMRTSSGTTAYVTSGNDGALGAYTYSKGAFTQTFQIPLHDARSLYIDGDTVGVVGGTPGLLTLVSAPKKVSMGSYKFDGADVAQSKTDVKLLGSKAFIAAGKAGVQVLSLKTPGKLLGKLPLPDAKALGLDPSYVTTNGVAVDGDLLFSANGGAGVYVAQGSQTFTSSDDKDVTMTTLGQLQLGTSANHVAYSGGYLIVATGPGGLKVVKVETK